jgi:hypothetical protein
MFSSKNKTFLLFLTILSSLLVSTAIFAVDKRELPSAQKANFGPQDISSQNERNEFFKPSRWGNDDTIATGPVYGGISATYDANGNIYAARCSTYNDTAQHAVIIYKSTDNGYTWQPFKFFVSAGGYNFSYPQILICQKADSNFLYLFYWRSDLNGRVRLGRWKLGGTGSPSWYDVVNGSGSDTVTYYSVCSNLDGDTIIVVYQTNSPSNPNPNLDAAVSADYGVHWSIISPGLSGAGAHPNLAYGNEGYVYLAYLRTDNDDIGFLRSTNNGYNWSGFEWLTNDGDSHHDDFPKIASLHTLPADTTTVWVAYNHKSGDKDTLKYDDNSPSYYFPLPDQWGDDLFNVRFTPNWDYQLKSAQFMFYHKVGTGAARIYVWADTNGYPAEKLDSVDVPDANIQPYPTWTTVDFSSKNITLTSPSDFHIGYTPLGPPETDTLSIISDDGLPTGTEHRSIEFYNGTWATIYDIWAIDVNFMIRAVVEKPISEDIDLRYAYSTNSGDDWTKDQIIANSSLYYEMAADLEVYRSSTNIYVDLCYVKYSGVVKSGSDICYTWAEAKYPEQFSSPHQTINEHWANWLPDGREVCQLTYPAYNGYPGIVYAGAPPLKGEAGNLVDGAWNLYYDFHDWTDVEETAEEKLPAQSSLSNNYPNPFNPETKIGYFIPKACQVKLEVFNILGQRVKTLVDEVQVAGKKEVTWDGKDESANEVASGVYFYKLQAGDFAHTKKMVLMK